MRCKICDSIIKIPTYNDDTEEWEPCPTCLDVIATTYEDPAEEDEFYSEVDEGDWEYEREVDED